MSKPFNITKALANVPDPPCARCKHEARCKAEPVACVGFMRYINGETRGVEPGHPNSLVYQQIFLEGA